MPESVVSLILDDEIRDPLEDIAFGPALLRQVVKGDQPPTLRFYRPAATLAFSGRDCVTPGIADAVRAALDCGFVPVRRGPGGRAAAYHPGAIGIDHVSSERDALSDIRSRFAEFGALLAGVLRGLGVDAQVGEVPGEYCPGEFSVNDGRGHKLIGTAQRLIPGGWLFSSILVVTASRPIAEVLDRVYPALGLSYDAATVGAVEDVVPGIGMDTVRAALVQAYAGGVTVCTGPMPAAVLADARAARSRYEVPSG